MRKLFKAYMRDPSLDREGRVLSATVESGLRDGRAAERVVIVFVVVGSQ